MSTPPDLLRIESSIEGRSPCITLHGELDHRTAPVLEEHVRRALDTAHPHLVFDVRLLVFCDSAGLSVLIGAYRRATRHGGTVVLRGLHPSLQRVLRLTGVEALFTIHPTRESDEVLDALGGHGEPA
ncbi:anti-sigma factor antagonist [Pseudonocardia acidicola]|uniref:Anti-sigma factor antagonist n=1 Tax=Pseudonocardia acidicola TaxID=2724939 RepID=A0ABX1SAE2_9PSEU|nr:STAS domain-containing protein [Pseudonocardia acidicola]